MPVSDFQINARVRAVLAKRWMDTHRLKFGSFKGTVRFSGQLHALGNRSASHLDAAKLEMIESELKRIRGVSRVFFDFTNWRKSETGEWVPQEKVVIQRSLQSDNPVVLEATDAKSESAKGKDADTTATAKN